MHKRLDERLSWEKKYYDFPSLLKLYDGYQRKRAPYSFKNNLHYLKHYVLHYFLNIKLLNSIDAWGDYFDEFRDWLETKATLVKTPGKNISYGSMNHTIRALNTFMTMLYKQKILIREYKCDQFPEHLLREKGIGDLISEEEMELVYAQLRENNHVKEAIFFRCLFFTGLRFNEGLGLHPGNFHKGKYESGRLKSYLENLNWNYYGYLVFDSQPSHETRGLRDANGVVHRKPLKGRKKIDDKSGRSVVIRDKVLWNDLIVLHNDAVDSYEQRTYGNDIGQYPIFDNMDKTTASVKVRKAFEACGLRYRSFHCCRHTRATLLIGETSDINLVKLWLGHTSDRVVRKYIHINEVMVRSAKKGGENYFVKLVQKIRQYCHPRVLLSSPRRRGSRLFHVKALTKLRNSRLSRHLYHHLSQ